MTISLPVTLNTARSLRNRGPHKMSRTQPVPTDRGPHPGCDDAAVQQQRLPSLLEPPIAFGHRGARAYAPDNTLESFALALRLGATGLESDVWLTADGVAGARPRRHGAGAPAPAADPRRGPRRPARARPGPGRPLRRQRHRLPPVARPQGRRRRPARAGGRPGPPTPTWWAGSGCATPTGACSASCARSTPTCAWSTPPASAASEEGPERRAAVLAEHGIDAINLHHTDWTGGLTTLFHRFDRSRWPGTSSTSTCCATCCAWASTASSATGSTAWWTRSAPRCD